MVIFLLDCNSVCGQRAAFKHHGKRPSHQWRHNPERCLRLPDPKHEISGNQRKEKGIFSCYFILHGNSISNSSGNSSYNLTAALGVEQELIPKEI